MSPPWTIFTPSMSESFFEVPHLSLGLNGSTTKRTGLQARWPGISVGQKYPKWNNMGQNLGSNSCSNFDSYPSAPARERRERRPARNEPTSQPYRGSAQPAAGVVQSRDLLSGNQNEPLFGVDPDAMFRVASQTNRPTSEKLQDILQHQLPSKWWGSQPHKSLC